MIVVVTSVKLLIVIFSGTKYMSNFEQLPKSGY